MGSCLGEPYLWASEGRLQKAELTTRQQQRPPSMFQRELIGLDGPSEIHHRLLQQKPQVFVFLNVHERQLSLQMEVTQGAGRLSFNIQDTESEGQSRWHAAGYTREQRRQECDPEVKSA